MSTDSSEILATYTSTYLPHVDTGSRPPSTMALDACQKASAFILVHPRCKESVDISLPKYSDLKHIFPHEEPTMMQRLGEQCSKESLAQKELTR